MLKNILSIDFDYLIDKEVSLHREFTDPFRKHKQWLRDYQEFPDLFNVDIQNHKFDYLLRYLLKLDRHTPILISDSHADIMTGLKTLYGGYDDPRTVYDITNVDHHHDIYYNDVIPYTDDQVGAANWVYHLYMQEKIRYYRWIHNPTSDPFLDTHGLGFTYKESIDITRLSVTPSPFDGIFIARSSSWVPPHLLRAFSLFASVLTIHFHNIHWIKSPGILLHEQPYVNDVSFTKEVVNLYDMYK
jgi:hypothetical protein